jgi:hypothetical protein
MRLLILVKATKDSEAGVMPTELEDFGDSPAIERFRNLALTK